MSASSTRIGASAPGKMLIGGEYAVLTGAPAIVSAVQTRAIVEWTDAPTPSELPAVARLLSHPEPRFPEAAAARKHAEKRLGEIPGELLVDVRALRSKTQKLGVGSSAAAAAAGAAAVYASHGLDVTQLDIRHQILECALQGHADVAPRGSGVDVAASVMGGTHRYVRDPLFVSEVKWPSALIPRIIWTGQAASTREFLDLIAAFQRSEPDRHAACMQAVTEATVGFAQTFAEGDVSLILAGTAALMRAVGALGDAAGAPIVEERLQRISELAAHCGGAAKPSGAGGGDVAIGLFQRESEAESFGKACLAEGFEVLDVALGGAGVLPHTRAV